eukprot:2665282-Amphidinium_carterae.2
MPNIVVASYGVERRQHVDTSEKRTGGFHASCDVSAKADSTATALCSLRTEPAFFPKPRD